MSHVVHDHTSVLKFIETKWNLGALTYRDANADNLLDSLDFQHRPFLEPPTLPKPGLPRAARPSPLPPRGRGVPNEQQWPRGGHSGIGRRQPALTVAGVAALLTERERQRAEAKAATAPVEA